MKKYPIVFILTTLCLVGCDSTEESVGSVLETGDSGEDSPVAGPETAGEGGSESVTGAPEGGNPDEKDGGESTPAEGGEGETPDEGGGEASSGGGEGVKAPAAAKKAARKSTRLSTPTRTRSSISTTTARPFRIQARKITTTTASETTAIRISTEMGVPISTTVLLSIMPFTRMHRSNAMASTTIATGTRMKIRKTNASFSTRTPIRMVPEPRGRSLPLPAYGKPSDSLWRRLQRQQSANQRVSGRSLRRYRQQLQRPGG